MNCIFVPALAPNGHGYEFRCMFLCQLISYVHVYSVAFSLTSNNTDCGTEGAKYVVRNKGLISINV